MTYTTHSNSSKLVPSTYLRRKIGIQVHNITPRPLSRTRRSPTNLPKSVLERCVITDLKHTVGGSAKVLLLSISPYIDLWVELKKVHPFGYSVSIQVEKAKRYGVHAAVEKTL